MLILQVDKESAICHIKHMKYYDYIIIGVSVAFILTAWFLIVLKFGKNFKKNNSDSDVSDGSVSVAYGYLSEKEYAFYKALCIASASLGYIALPKVHLAEILSSKDDRLRRSISFNRVIDFCLFTDYEFRPVLAIDLYDNTISDQSVFEMDSVTKRLVASCNIPILKHETMAIYIQADLKREIEEAISSARVVVNKNG